MKQQLELFDGFVRLRTCRKCQRELHRDPTNIYRTREAGLCFSCLREFDASPFWTVDGFIGWLAEEAHRKALAEFYEAADQFEDMF